MRAQAIIDALLGDVSPEDFIDKLPVSALYPMVIVQDRHQGLVARAGYEGQHMVYQQADDNARNFIGYIKELRASPWAEAFYWIVTGVAIPHPDRVTKIQPYESGKNWRTEDEAAKELADAYRKYNGL